MGREMFESLIFPRDARILEVGFGHGYWAAWAAGQVPKGAVVAVDLDPRMLDWARQQYPISRFPNLEYRLADARTLDFVAEPFDYVMSNACLHYLDHPGHAFEAMARHLKPGGRMCVVCLGQGNLAQLHQVLQRVIRQLRWQPYFESFGTPWALVDGAACDPWLVRAGLVKKQARLFNEAVQFPTRSGFQDWLDSNFANYREAVPEALRLRFSDELVEAYCRRPGPVTVHRVWLQLEARKPG